MGYAARRKASRRLKGCASDGCDAEQDAETISEGGNQFSVFDFRSLVDPTMGMHDELNVSNVITIFSPGPQHARTKQTPEGVVLVSGKLGSRDAKYSAVDIAMVPRPISRTAWDFWDSIGRPRFV